MLKVCDDTALAYIQNHFGDLRASKVASIQTLWSGYGEIARYFLPSLQRSVIAKLVKPPSKIEHPRGWGGECSHQRKLDSYVNESVFYDQYSPQTDLFCRTPACYSSLTFSVPERDELIANSKATLLSKHTRAKQYNPVSLLIMEDLDRAGFAQRCGAASLETVRLGIRWLAHFHATFLNQALPEVWPVGTYWHLATRPDEYENMPESELKQKANKIDSRLNNARYQTLLHGDAKLANFCFSDDGNDLAAVDFQYVGRGAGIKDVMYFMGSCLDGAELMAHADALLDEYFVLLKQAIMHNSEGAVAKIDFAELEAEWRDLWPFAWADFQRFLVGWATEHYKMNAYMQEQTGVALVKCG